MYLARFPRVFLAHLATPLDPGAILLVLLLTTSFQM